MSRHHCRCPNSCTQWNSGHVVETNVQTSLPLPKQLYPVEQQSCGGNQCPDIIAAAKTAVPSGIAAMWWKPMSLHHCRCPNSCTQWNSSHVVETNVQTSLPLPKQLYPVEQRPCGGNQCTTSLPLPKQLYTQCESQEQALLLRCITYAPVICIHSPLGAGD